jgi:uncharacterized RDD family membrane protein YckC
LSRDSAYLGLTKYGRDKKNLKLLRTIICPEGLKLTVRVATLGERFLAFFFDEMFIVFGLVVLSVGISRLFGSHAEATVTFLNLAFFLVINFYFLYFELSRQGRTPGKGFMRLKVINRRGGELTPAMVIARNLTRPIEFFLPVIYLISVIKEGHTLSVIFDLAFLVVMVILPVVTKDNLRLGDLLGGTMVAAMPKAVLLEDLTAESRKSDFIFTPQHLGIYGTLELQTLEDILRIKDVHQAESLRKIAETIIKKIEYKTTVPQKDTLRFLKDFYAAERRLLEREQLFGRHKDDQKSKIRLASEPEKSPKESKEPKKIKIPQLKKKSGRPQN